MDIERAKELILALAEGIDPITGEVLPPDHVCNNAEIIRAFYTVLRKNDVPNVNPEKKKKYESSGKRWTLEDDELLKELYNQGLKSVNFRKNLCAPVEV